MKRFCKVPFSKVVEEAGLNRAARWMPVFSALFMVWCCVSVFHDGDYDDAFAFLTCYDPSGLFIAFFAVSLFFAGAEFFGALVDLLLAWLRLGRQKQ